MNRYKKIFTQLHQNKLGAFVPFVTIGDPNPITFISIVNTLIQSGADALELGIPFSDPVSDGPSIQKSIQRSFKAGMNFFNCLKLIEIIRTNNPNLPIGLLVYANLIFKNDINNFYKRCAKLSIDSVLVPDLPIEESYSFQKSANDYEISHIFMCPPNATSQLIEDIVSHHNNNNNGYIYLMSRPGVTGINKTEFDCTVLNMLINRIKKKQKMLPILQGFGVYTPLQAHTSVQLGASGIILGSAIADIIETNQYNIKCLLTELQKLTQLMKKSMQLNT